MDDAALLAKAFEQAAETTYREAAEVAGQPFHDWASTYLWFAEHDQPHLVTLEKKRLQTWLRLAREAGVTDDKMPKESEIERNWESATLIFGFDPRPLADSAFEMPRGGERQMTVAQQLHDPLSPLNRGLEDFLDFRSQN